MMVTISDIYNKLSEYEKDNYYLKDEMGNELKPQLIGNGWEKLAGGQEIEMNENTYKSLKDGINPFTSEQLVPPGVNGERRPGYNLTFNPHKSFSVLAHSSHEYNQIVNNLIDKAVNDVMAYFEKHLVQVRQTQAGVTEPVKTGNMLAMRVDHSVNRDGDIHKHPHIVVFNMSYNEQTGKWQAVHSDPFHTDLLTILFNNQLAYYAKEAGLPIEFIKSDSGRTEYAAIAGVPEKAIEVTSERAKQIDKYIEDHREELLTKYPNAGEGELKQIAAIETRQAKQAMTPQEIQKRFEDKLEKNDLTKEGIVDAVINKAHEYQGREDQKLDRYEVVRTAVNSLSDYQSVFSHQDILKNSAAIAKGDVSLKEIEYALKELRGENIKLKETHTIKNGTRTYADSLYTTKEVMDAEKKILNAVKDGQGKASPIMDREAVNNFLQQNHPKLTQSQKDTLTFLMSSHDSINAVQGFAGTGKTTVMKTARELLDANGYKAVGLSETNTAVNEMKAAGIGDAMTVSKFLHSYAAQKSLDDRTVVIIDESSFLGSKNFSKLIDIAQRQGSRFSLWGDKDQLPPVAAGGMFTHLIENKIINYVELKDIVRQKDEAYKSAVYDIINKDISSAVNKIEAKEDLHEVTFQSVKEKNPNLSDREIRQLQLEAIREKTVELYVKNDGYRNFVGSVATNEQRSWLNERIRTELQGKGVISKEQADITIYASKNLSDVERFKADSYGVGDKLYVIKGGAGIKVGSELTVSRVDAEKNKIYATDSKGFEREIDIRRHGEKFAAYSPEKIQLAKGDKVIFNKSIKDGPANSDIAYVKSVNKDEKGNVKSVTFDYMGKEYTTDSKHFEHGYAYTAYKSQGKTSQGVIYTATKTQAEGKYQEFYVSISRGKERAIIVTDSKEQLIKDAAKTVEKETTLKYTKSGDMDKIINHELKKEQRELLNVDIQIAKLKEEGKDTGALEQKRAEHQEKINILRDARQALKNDRENVHQQKEAYNFKPELKKKGEAYFRIDKTKDKNIGSSWKRVGKPMDLKRYNMASNNGERAFKGARKSV
ncbi:MAG: MobF family relaxase [Nitrospirota bacterium]